MGHLKETESAGQDEAQSPRRTGVGPIVSSAHLSGRAAELSELEFGLIVAGNAFNRWMVRCMTAAGLADMSPLDVLVLHSVNHRGRAKKCADICLVLNVEDTHTVTYSLKKLLKHGVVVSERRGKETFYTITEKGESVCRAYAEIRENCLVDSLRTLGFSNTDLGSVASFLRGISGLYDQAARSAASL
ncbi:winged helix DNA-binding protein [uncultured Marinobacter sp.]|uniref:winged helix DNA-binding protein n=1 Tax=uncultured Marinobacter sp. TaxID=187379 RepID=UPI000C0A351A|nr:transcriptional regulator [Marinobacter sp.]MBI42534.1 transcriptional regulator [Oceanospirillales bacterium]|tara:strand:- start:8649 stop:9212 length:564 start_codon:yes stop_codon:yes gene_type:complete